MGNLDEIDEVTENTSMEVVESGCGGTQVMDVVLIDVSNVWRCTSVQVFHLSPRLLPLFILIDFNFYCTRFVLQKYLRNS
jgi:hypothetical protein